MPRKARLDATGVLLHVMARGTEGRDIFRDTKDREAFLRRLSEVVTEGSVQLLAIEKARLKRKDKDSETSKTYLCPPLQGSVHGVLFPPSQEKHRLGPLQKMEGDQESIGYRGHGQGLPSSGTTTTASPRRRHRRTGFMLKNLIFLAIPVKIATDKKGG